ncbi:hypothetical protein [Sinomonas gamaensis]|uniref:hypothetical protein n=1 Tax=Sinomonas gamaensis TaxID=2565624 RepID=UPI001107D3DD|nr:hypothetical protein [Sinomonas gamaensis]
MQLLGHLLDTSQRNVGVLGRGARAGFAAGELIRLRRGFYFPTSLWLGARPDERFQIALSAYMQANPESVFCSETALFVRGIPTVKAPPAIDVVATSNGRLGVAPPTFQVRGGSPAAIRARRFPPPPVRRHLHRDLDAEEVGGYRSVPLVEALIEVLASGKFPRALTVADGVLRSSPSTPLLERPEVRKAIDRLTAASQRRRAELIAALARPGAESPGESVSRALMHLFGFPEPLLQKEHFDPLGFIGRTDFFWDMARRPVGEFDGWGKYFRNELTGGEDPGTIIRREKRRENRLLALGHQVLRWDWADLEQPIRLRTKLLEAGLRPRTRRLVVEKIA